MYLTAMSMSPLYASCIIMYSTCIRIINYNAHAITGRKEIPTPCNHMHISIEQYTNYQSRQRNVQNRSTREISQGAAHCVLRTVKYARSSHYASQ